MLTRPRVRLQVGEGQRDASEGHCSVAEASAAACVVLLVQGPLHTLENPQQVEHIVSSIAQHQQRRRCERRKLQVPYQFVGGGVLYYSQSPVIAATSEGALKARGSAPTSLKQAHEPHNPLYHDKTRLNRRPEV